MGCKSARSQRFGCSTLIFATDICQEDPQLEELMKQLVEKTGLPVDKLEQVVGMVIGFIGDKLPGPMAGAVNALFDGDGGSGGGGGGLDVGGMLDQAKGMLGGLLGSDK